MMYRMHLAPVPARWMGPLSSVSKLTVAPKDSKKVLSGPTGNAPGSRRTLLGAHDRALVWLGRNESAPPSRILVTSGLASLLGHQADPSILLETNFWLHSSL